MSGLGVIGIGGARVLAGLVLPGWAKAGLGLVKAVPGWLWWAAGGVAAALLAWHVHGGWEKAGFDRAFDMGWTSRSAEVAAYRRSVAALQSAVADQNAAVDRLKAESDARGAAAATALQGARAAAASAETQARELEASAANAAAARRECAGSARYQATRAQL